MPQSHFHCRLCCCSYVSIDWSDDGDVDRKRKREQVAAMSGEGDEAMRGSRSRRDVEDQAMHDEMVDRLTREGLQPVTSALAKVGIHVSCWTAVRWARCGVRGHRLESLKVGGRWHTSVAAVRRFLASRDNHTQSPDQARPISRLATESFLRDLGLGRSEK